MYKTHQTEKKSLGYNFKEVIKTMMLHKSLFTDIQNIFFTFLKLSLSAADHKAEKAITKAGAMTLRLHAALDDSYDLSLWYPVCKCSE